MSLHQPKKLTIVLDLTPDDARQLIRLIQRQADDSVRLRRFVARYDPGAEVQPILTTWEQLAEEVRAAVTRAQAEQLQ